jgi:dihydrofolate reductase
MIKFIIIACINKKRVIGKNGKLLYHINNDISNFAKMTKNNGVVIMGRKTFESLPNSEPLKDRINIIITSDKEYGINKCFNNTYIVHSIQDVIELCEAFFSDKELFVIGGETIYRQFMESNLVDELRLTVVEDDADGDVVFPEINEEDWDTYYKSMIQGSDQSFYFQILKKKK